MFDYHDFLKKLQIHILLLGSAFFGGALGFHYFYPDEHWVKLLFMTAITLSTVGYGDVLNVENNPAAAMYTMILMLVGMGIVLYSVSTVTAFFVEGKVGKLLSIQSMRRRARKMNDHYIICGAGKTGVHVIREMIENEKDYIVIENDEEKIAELKKDFTDILVIQGDATSDETLELVNLSGAKGMVATLENDKDNLFLCITARMLNPNLEIVSKAIEFGIVNKLKRAGADYVVCPNFIGGMRIASEILRPNVVNFLDKMLRGKDNSMRVGEVSVGQDSVFINKPLKDVKVYDMCSVNIIAFRKAEQDNFIYNPPPEVVVEMGDTLLFIGSAEQQQRMDKMFS
ncbi:MAG: potassium channel protein [Bacteriovoracaceae bacterium]|nr:potassium channel protein [Bacteriovoracaceae bacterium]